MGSQEGKHPASALEDARPGVHEGHFDCFGSRSAFSDECRTQIRQMKKPPELKPCRLVGHTLAATAGESFEEDVPEFLATHPVAGHARCSDWSDALRDKRSIGIAISGACAVVMACPPATTHKIAPHPGAATASREG